MTLKANYSERLDQLISQGKAEARASLLKQQLGERPPPSEPIALREVLRATTKLGGAILAAIPVGIGMSLVGYQSYMWLKTGMWSDITVSEALGLLEIRIFKPTDWVGVQQILDWIGGWSVWMIFMVLGVLVGWAYYEEHYK